MQMKELILSELSQNLTDFTIQNGSEQRTIGDLVEDKVREICRNFSKNSNYKFIDRRSKKSLEDFTLVGADETGKKFYYFDPKTHDVNAEFSMPNLSSVDKLKKLLQSTNEELLNVFISYKIENQTVKILHIDVRYIWELDFNSLRVGSLGKGQLQISDMKKGILLTEEGKTKWFENLKSKVREYHLSQIERIEKEKEKWK
jgi:hypothetical protein